MSVCHRHYLFFVFLVPLWLSLFFVVECVRSGKEVTDSVRDEKRSEGETFRPPT